MVTLFRRMLDAHRRSLHTEARPSVTVQRDRSRSRPLAVTLVLELMTAMALSLVPATAVADEWTYEKAFNDNELWTSEDPTGDWTANPKKYNKKGKEKFRTGWDLALADVNRTRAIRVPVEDGVAHEFHVYYEQWRGNSKRRGKRTAQVAGVVVYGDDGSPMLRLWGAHNADQGSVSYEVTSREYVAPYQRPDDWRCASHSYVTDPHSQALMFDVLDDCFPTTATTITRIDFISQVRVFNKKGKSRVKSYDRNVMDGLSIAIR